MPIPLRQRRAAHPHRDVARVLVADDNPTSRLTLKTVLEAGGYRVDSAASAAEAVGLLDRSEYALVLSDLAMESPEAGLVVLEHARMQPYRPAAALFTSTHRAGRKQVEEMLIKAQDLPDFLGKVAGLISSRASRRAARSLRQAS
jgi:CheY-like chemotaxis protein